MAPLVSHVLSRNTRGGGGEGGGESLGKVHSKTSFEKNCFSAWASTLNMGLINKVDMVCLSPVGYGV